MNEITSMIPRLVIDFPYMKMKDAKKLSFKHEYLFNEYYREVFEERQLMLLMRKNSLKEQ